MKERERERNKNYSSSYQYLVSIILLNVFILKREKEIYEHKKKNERCELITGHIVKKRRATFLFDVTMNT
jgi:hypothetical protein